MSNPFSTATGSTDRRPPPAQTRPEDYTTHGAPGHPQNSHRLALMKVEKKQITKKTVTEEHPAEITRQPYTAAPWEPRGINWDYHINATKNRKNTMEVCSHWVDASWMWMCGWLTDGWYHVNGWMIDRWMDDKLVDGWMCGWTTDWWMTERKMNDGWMNIGRTDY